MNLLNNLPQTQRMAIKVEGTRVLVIIDDRLVANLPWEAAQEVSRSIMHRAKVAEQNHWAEIERYQPVPIKNLLGIPVVTSYKQYERMGDRKPNGKKPIMGFIPMQFGERK